MPLMRAIDVFLLIEILKKIKYKIIEYIKYYWVYI